MGKLQKKSANLALLKDGLELGVTNAYKTSAKKRDSKNRFCVKRTYDESILKSMYSAESHEMEESECDFDDGDEVICFN